MTKLDKALVLAQHELKALEAGDIDKATSLMHERKEVLDDAYGAHDEKSQADYTLKLAAIQNYSQQILEKGNVLRDSLRQGIKQSSKSVQASNKYKRASL